MRLVLLDPPLADAAAQIGSRVVPLLRVEPVAVLASPPVPIRFAGLDEVIDRRLHEVLHRQTDRWQSMVANGDQVVSAVDVTVSDGEFVVVSVIHGTYAAEFDRALAHAETVDAADLLGDGAPEDPPFHVASLRIPGLSLNAVHLSNQELDADLLLILLTEDRTPVADLGGQLHHVADLEDVLAERAEEARDQWDAAPPGPVA